MQKGEIKGCFAVRVVRVDSADDCIIAGCLSVRLFAFAHKGVEI